MVRLIASFRMEGVLFAPVRPDDAKGLDDRTEASKEQTDRGKDAGLWDPPYSQRK